MASASYLGAFFQVAGPLIDILAHMGGNTTARVATLLADPPTSKLDQSWAASVHAAHHEALEMQASFTPQDLHTINLIAPRGNIIRCAGDPRVVATDLPSLA
jgi:hypothetical protein